MTRNETMARIQQLYARLTPQTPAAEAGMLMKQIRNLSDQLQGTVGIIDCPPRRSTRNPLNPKEGTMDHDKPPFEPRPPYATEPTPAPKPATEPNPPYKPTTKPAPAPKPVK